MQMATMLGGATPRTLCLIDEFGKGTNAQDRVVVVSEEAAREAGLAALINYSFYIVPAQSPLTDSYTKQDGISLLYACLQHFLDRKAECPKVIRAVE